VIAVETRSSEGREKYRPLERLRRHSDFDFVYTHGARCSGPFVIVHVLNRQDDGIARLGTTVSRRCGKAHVRNRIRRRFREMVRRESRRIRGGRDIILTARRAAADASYAQLRAQVLGCLAREGVLVSDD
jgi:ribonuclease P protein component